MNSTNNISIPLSRIKPKSIFLYKFPVKTIDENQIMKAVTPPLFHYKHYVLCVSIQNPPNFPVLIIPLTTRRPKFESEEKSAYEFPSNPIPYGGMKEVWAITSHIYSVNHKDLEYIYYNGKVIIPKIGQKQFDEISKKMLFRLNLNCLDK